MPGGAGTLDELFEALTLIQTGKINNFPIVLMGTSYWKELIDLINKMAEFGTIDRADVNLIYATDSVDEAIAHIRNNTIEPFGLKLSSRIRRNMRWLGERALPKGAPK
jgi:predicted Rossmann-fold nucleotide-binding protein